MFSRIWFGPSMMSSSPEEEYYEVSSDMELQDTFTSGEEETEIFENKFDDAEEQRSDGTAAVRDVQDSPGTAELHEVGSRNKKKTDTALERKIKRITEQFKAEKKSLTEEIERHKHTISQHEKEIARLKTFEDHQPNLIQEIDRLKTFESVHQAHKEQICNLKEELENAKTSQIKLENKLRQVDSEKSSLNGIVQGLRKDNLSLVEEKECLLLRLSKLAGAKLTLDNPNIADLSDQKRPTKLAEEFAELYDNEWTDAFEDVKTTNEQEKTAFMLKLLQRASEICRQVSYEHMDGMKKSICTLTVRTNPSDLSRRTLKSKQQINVRADSKANDMTDAKRSRRNSQQDYTEAHGPSIVVLPDTNVEDDSIEYIVQNEYEVIQSSNTLVPETSQMQLREVTCDLQHDQKKIIMELRKSIEDKLSGEIEAFVTDTIARENHIDNLNQIALIKYIAKCVSICWAMCRLEPPVFIGFPEVQGDMFLDTNVYKPYTKTGQFVDYIVWPVLYLHENGPVLSKGVAQGRE